MPDLDSRSLFYLGRDHDLASGKTSAEPLLYKSSQLTTHAVCVGMTGSGKTGLCLSLLEEAALDGVPAICIDPKGDLGNLLLGFPQLRPEDFRPWVDESVAQRKGVTPDEFAQETAELWKNGLASWEQGPERVERYNDAVERVIFTPGASHGIPLTVLRSFDAPPKAVREDVDLFRGRVQSAVSGLLALLGIDADPVRSREHIYVSNILTVAWEKGENLSVAELIREIESPPFKTVGVMEVDKFFPEKERTALAMDLNNLLASPSFAGWMAGQPLDVQQLFYSPEGKPRHSILSIAHLDDAQRMFFVTILLSEVLTWMRSQPGTSSLRALLYMDEVFGYFPPSKNPPSKLPMLTLLKQARAFGLGVVLATQNPVDLDYKGLSNTGAWFLGRLQTERDKLRVMEGLEGASAQAGSTFDKQEMERTLAGLGNRVFLLNNVHENQPRVFQTRWALSYLAGPLSRDQIKRLMDPVRKKFVTEAPKAKKEESPQLDPVSEQEESEASNDQNETDASVTAGQKKPETQKVKNLRLKLVERENALAWSIFCLPCGLPELVFRAYELNEARRQKRATTRKASSVRAAAIRASSKLSRPFEDYGKWTTARARLEDSSPNDYALGNSWLPVRAIAAICVLMIMVIIAGIALTAVVRSFMVVESPPAKAAISELPESDDDATELPPQNQAP